MSLRIHLIALTLYLLVGSSVRAGEYQVTDLQIPGISGSATDISNGDPLYIVGSYVPDTDHPDTSRPYIWTTQEGAITLPCIEDSSGLDRGGSALAVNDLGQAVGSCQVECVSPYWPYETMECPVAVLWEEVDGDWQVKRLGTVPGGLRSVALAINNLGDVAGWTNSPAGHWLTQYPASWREEQIVYYGPRRDIYSEDLDDDQHPDFTYEDQNGNCVLDANEDLDGDGHLDVGEDLNCNGVLDPHEDIDEDGLLDLHEDLDGDGVFESIALGVVFSNGQMTGIDDQRYAAVSSTQSYVLDIEGNNAQRLGELAGGRYSTVYDITQTNRACGYAEQRINPKQIFSAVRWDNTSATPHIVDLGTLYTDEGAPFQINYGYGMNDHAQVVGWAVEEWFHLIARAIVSHGGQIMDLNDWIDMTGWQAIFAASAINNQGDIVGKALGVDGRFHSVLLTPPDCNENDIDDFREVAQGLAFDCDGNWTPDECDVDCDANGIPDACDIDENALLDCDNNNILDDCDLLRGAAEDCNQDGTIDSCQLGELLAFARAGSRAIPRDEVLSGDPGMNPIQTIDKPDMNMIPKEGVACPRRTHDRDGDCVLDICTQDCNENGQFDILDIELLESFDCDEDLIPDECEDTCRSTSACPDADVDCNGQVNTLDRAMIRNGANFGKSTCQARDQRADVNHDGSINGLDIAAISTSACWGS